jgi:hypothetical protein
MCRSVSIAKPDTSGIYRHSHDRYGRSLTLSFRELYAMWVDSLVHSVISSVVLRGLLMLKSASETNGGFSGVFFHARFSSQSVDRC